MERSSKDQPSSLQLWDRGCVHDDARQAFVLPLVRELVNDIKPTMLIDIGARTGYLLWALLISHSLTLRAARLIAIDHDHDAVEYMRRRFHNTHVEVVHAQAEEWVAGDRPDKEKRRALHILAYTALELDKDALCTMFASVSTGDSLVVILPDVAEDVELAGQLSHFLTVGTVYLRKVDKFTGRVYPFIARRLEIWLPWALESGLCLQRVRSYRTARDHRHYAFYFDGPAVRR